MFTVIQYTNYRKEQDISIHGYFTDNDKAIEYCKKKAYETMKYYENDYILKLNGYDYFIDTENHILLRDNNKFGNIKNKFNCVAVKNKISDEIYEEIIQNGLDILECEEHEFTKENTSIYTLLDQIIGGEEVYKIIVKEHEKKIVNEMISEHDELLKKIFTKVIISGNAMNDNISQDEMIESVSSEIFAIIETFENTDI
jgi:hypothetical protein